MANTLKRFTECRYCDFKADTNNKTFGDARRELFDHVREKHPEARKYKL